MSKKNTKPEPVVVSTLCSECGLDWGLHGEEPTTDDCIRLLKAELSRKRLRFTPMPKMIPYPYTPPYTPPIYPNPYAEWQPCYKPATFGTSEAVGINKAILYNTPLA